jgi:hypothetical protein
LNNQEYQSKEAVYEKIDLIGRHGIAVGGLRSTGRDQRSVQQRQRFWIIKQLQ